jgi:hypothetical protein
MFGYVWLRRYAHTEGDIESLAQQVLRAQPEVIGFDIGEHTYAHAYTHHCVCNGVMPGSTSLSHDQLANPNPNPGGLPSPLAVRVNHPNLLQASWLSQLYLASAAQQRACLSSLPMRVCSQHLGATGCINDIVLQHCNW